MTTKKHKMAQRGKKRDNIITVTNIRVTKGQTNEHKEKQKRRVPTWYRRCYPRKCYAAFSHFWYTVLACLWSSICYILISSHMKIFHVLKIKVIYHLTCIRWWYRWVVSWWRQRKAAPACRAAASSWRWLHPRRLPPSWCLASASSPPLLLSCCNKLNVQKVKEEGDFIYK